MGHIRDKEITEQLLSNFSHLSTGTLWNATDFFTSFTSFTLQTTMQKLKDKLNGKFGLYLTHSMMCMKNIHTECEKYEWDCALSGSSRSTTQMRDLVRWHRGEAWTHINQITTKKVCTLHFTMFKNKYLGVCGLPTSGV
jgi:hypothetical protein